MKRLALLFLALIAGLASPRFAAADTFYMRDGRIIEGEITREGDEYVYVTYKVGEMARTELLLKSDIERIDRDSAPADAPPPTPAPSSPTGRPAPPAPAPAASTRLRADGDLPPGTRKIAFITLEDTVGPLINADALVESVKLLEEDPPDIVVLHFNSGGGALVEVQKLSDVIEHQIKPKHRVVAWVTSAISAAAMTAWTCEEIYMEPRGNIGAATAFMTTSAAGAVAVKGEDLEQIFRMMEDITKRGNHDSIVMRAMQTPTDLSADIDPVTGKVTWHNNLDGQHIVSTTKQILTFNSIDAVKFGIARGVANTKDDLAAALGASSWVEVGQSADAYQQEFRASVKEAQVRAGELLSKLNVAERGRNLSRGRAFLGQLRGLVRRAPSLEQYGAGDFGVPPLTEEFFQRIEDQLQAIADRESKRRR